MVSATCYTTITDAYIYYSVLLGQENQMNIYLVSLISRVKLLRFTGNVAHLMRE